MMVSAAAFHANLFLGAFVVLTLQSKFSHVFNTLPYSIGSMSIYYLHEANQPTPKGQLPV